MIKQLTTALVLAASIGTAAPNAFAQQDREVAEAEFGLGLSPMPAPLISLDFPGGTLTDFVEALRDASDAPLNIAVEGPADQMAIMPLEVSDVTPNMVLAHLRNASHTSDGTTLRINYVQSTSPGARSIHRLVVNEFSFPQGNSRSTNRESREVIVLQIRNLTTPWPGDVSGLIVEPETILTAVETTLGVADVDPNSTSMKYHPASGLLILAGPDDALAAAQRVVREIENEIQSRRNQIRQVQAERGIDDPEELELELADAQSSLRQAEVRAEVAERRLVLAHQQMDETRELVDGGFVEQQQILSAEMDIIQGEANLEEARIEIERRKHMYERIARRLDAARELAGPEGSDERIASLTKENAMLRDRLAAMEAQVAALQSQLADVLRNADPRGTGR